ncbi:hypothetical protein SNEBB_005532 [Seison nebaliae]|nr:hypothetical protein SNEBB_005532 [Seison nebaliae]
MKAFRPAPRDGHIGNQNIVSQFNREQNQSDKHEDHSVHDGDSLNNGHSPNVIQHQQQHEVSKNRISHISESSSESFTKSNCSQSSSIIPNLYEMGKEKPLSYYRPTIPNLYTNYRPSPNNQYKNDDNRETFVFENNHNSVSDINANLFKSLLSDGHMKLPVRTHRLPTAKTQITSNFKRMYSDEIIYFLHYNDLDELIEVLESEDQLNGRGLLRITRYGNEAIVNNYVRPNHPARILILKWIELLNITDEGYWSLNLLLNSEIIKILDFLEQYEVLKHFFEEYPKLDGEQFSTMTNYELDLAFDHYAKLAKEFQLFLLENGIPFEKFSDIDLLRSFKDNPDFIQCRKVKFRFKITRRQRTLTESSIAKLTDGISFDLNVSSEIGGDRSLNESNEEVVKKNVVTSELIQSRIRTYMNVILKERRIPKQKRGEKVIKESSIGLFYAVQQKFHLREDMRNFLIIGQNESIGKYFVDLLATISQFSFSKSHHVIRYQLSEPTKKIRIYNMILIDAQATTIFLNIILLWLDNVESDNQLTVTNMDVMEKKMSILKRKASLLEPFYLGTIFTIFTKTIYASNTAIMDSLSNSFNDNFGVCHENIELINIEEYETTEANDKSNLILPMLDDISELPDMSENNNQIWENFDWFLKYVARNIRKHFHKTTETVWGFIKNETKLAIEQMLVSSLKHFATTEMMLNKNLFRYQFKFQSDLLSVETVNGIYINDSSVKNTENFDMATSTDRVGGHKINKNEKKIPSKKTKKGMIVQLENDEDEEVEENDKMKIKMSSHVAHSDKQTNFIEDENGNNIVPDEEEVNIEDLDRMTTDFNKKQDEKDRYWKKSDNWMLDSNSFVNRWNLFVNQSIFKWNVLSMNLNNNRSRKNFKKSKLKQYHQKIDQETWSRPYEIIRQFDDHIFELESLFHQKYNTFLYDTIKKNFVSNDQEHVNGLFDEDLEHYRKLNELMEINYSSALQLQEKRKKYLKKIKEDASEELYKKANMNI